MFGHLGTKQIKKGKVTMLKSPFHLVTHIKNKKTISGTLRESISSFLKCSFYLKQFRRLLPVLYCANLSYKTFSIVRHRLKITFRENLNILRKRKAKGLHKVLHLILSLQIEVLLFMQMIY